MTDDVTIRRATPADLDRFRPLYLDLSRYSWSFRTDRSGLAAALVRRAAAAPGCLAFQQDRQVLLALSGERAVGYVVCGVFPTKPDSLDAAATVGSIDELFVDPAARHRRRPAAPRRRRRLVPRPWHPARTVGGVCLERAGARLLPSGRLRRRRAGAHAGSGGRTAGVMEAAKTDR